MCFVINTIPPQQMFVVTKHAATRGMCAVSGELIIGVTVCRLQHAAGCWRAGFWRAESQLMDGGGCSQVGYRCCIALAPDVFFFFLLLNCFGFEPG